MDVNIEDLKLDEMGLIPAVVIDCRTKKVLTLAYMNRESLAISLQEGRTCFWSRSWLYLWRNGEPSGYVQHIVRIDTDCDCDALTVYVQPEGPACHTGAESCFFNTVYAGEEPFSLEGLMKHIEGRKTEKKGIDKILKKVGEESTEVIIAGKADDKAETIYEISDLIYHVLVLMVQMGISIDDIYKELASRHVIDHKVKQEKMTK